jgi:hypothetical protein
MTFQLGDTAIADYTGWKLGPESERGKIRPARINGVTCTLPTFAFVLLLLLLLLQQHCAGADFLPS